MAHVNGKVAELVEEDLMIMLQRLHTKEIHEEDDPQYDNLFCRKNTVSNAMPAVWRYTLDIVATNRSYCRCPALQLSVESS